MAKVSSLCIISLLVFLTLSSYAVARPLANLRDVTPVETSHSNPTNYDEVGKAFPAEEMVSCEGQGEDECMMRRTLVAHLDYIYTNNVNSKP